MEGHLKCLTQLREVCAAGTIAKLIKIKVLMHPFWNLMFNFHDMCLLNKISHPKYKNMFHS